MAADIDLDARRITASVGSLLGEAETRAIGLGGTGLSRLWIGQELHRRVQRELGLCDPGFRAEVYTSTELEVDGWQVLLSGRADGVVYEGQDPTRVDEIKTLHFAVDLYNLYIEERLQRFRNQARLYAWMLSTPDRPAAARLILVDIVTKDERIEEVAWTAQSVESWLRQQVHRMVAVETRRLRRLESLREASGRLPFPHPEKRPVQVEVGEAVSASLAEDRHLLVRAPTGCGKTAAVLHPALKAALGRGRRLFFLTAKTLQQQIAVHTAQAMQEDLFRSLQLRAKGKMCAHTEIVCHEEYCPFARDYGVKLVRSGLLRTLLDEDPHQDPDRIHEAARAQEVCPFEVSLDLLPEIDLVVCDYNYVFDPFIGLGAVLDGGALRQAVLIIDEAHNLVDRSREYYSPTLDTAAVAAATAYLASRDNEVFRKLAAHAERLGELIHETVSNALGEQARGVRQTVFPEHEVSEQRIAFDGAILQYFVYKRENDLWMARDPVMDLFLALTRFHRILGLGGEEFEYLAERKPDGAEELRICCLDSSRFLNELLEESAGAVAMSATLEPFDFYRNLLGFDPHRTDELFVPSPFPPENRLVLSIDGPDTTYRHRAEHYDGIASWITRIAHPGHNVLTLFPSYAFLNAVRDRMPACTHTVLVQSPGSSDLEQREILLALDNGGSHLLLAVLGGIFAEGVDYPGAMLSQVIVVSPGLPQYNMERELLKAYYREHYGHSFEYAYLIPGLTRVVQAAGRLLRSDTDRGVITLIGKRFQDRRYARLLPEEWTNGDASTMLREDPEAEVRLFFATPAPTYPPEEQP